MKKLTFSTMAAARLRANKRQYLSLVLGIFLSIFMVSTLVLSVWGIYQAYLQKRYDKVGFTDVVIFETDALSEEVIHTADGFERFGHAYISGIVTDRNVYVGSYDEEGLALMNLTPVEGRLPEAPGEIAMEASAMDILEVSWNVGEEVELAITPVDGQSESRRFTLVGIIPERSVYLTAIRQLELSQFPAIVTHSQEPSFSTGRMGCHHLLGLVKHYELHQKMEQFYIRCAEMGQYNTMFGLSVSGEQVWSIGGDNFIYYNQEMFGSILMACLMAVALLLSCGIGISGSLEGILSKRREEIGVLRALGATRRQIRQMFGRENLMIALFLSPLSILASLGAVRLLAKLLPDRLIFTINLWLIVPIGLFSILMILLSGYLPLVRSSRLMPMSVIRDTAMLRRSKGVKSKGEFSVPRLMASRQVRFYPTRQLGASVLVGLMLLCSGLMVGYMYTYSPYDMDEIEAFRISGDDKWDHEDHIDHYVSPSMDKQGLEQIRRLDNVRGISMDRSMMVNVLLDKVPMYAIFSGQYGMLDDEQYEKAVQFEMNGLKYEDRPQEQERYQKFLNDYGISQEAYQISIVTVDLQKNQELLKSYVYAGKIDLDAINAGREVIVYAPEIWVKANEQGYGYRMWQTEEDAKNDPYGEGAELAAWNDAFIAGEHLPIMQLYRTEANGVVHRVDTGASVGAVLSFDENLIGGFFANPVIITTETGLENLGLPQEGLSEICVYLDGQITQEEEEILERQLNAIARRYDGYSVYNAVEFYRSVEADNRERIMLCAAMAVVFFSVSVGMIVSALTRRIHSEGRTIGMLRAVGADEKAILGCYGGQINASVFGGMILSFCLLLGYALLYIIVELQYGGVILWSEIKLFLLMGAVGSVVGILCLLICKFLLRFRIREIVNKSIIDNIREL